MLIQFTVKNYKTFKDRVTLSMVASSDKAVLEAENVWCRPESECSADSLSSSNDNNKRKKKELRLLKSAVIYGANASGKSKLLEALAFMKQFVRNSSKESMQGEQIEITPFLLNSETENNPSEFELVFLIGDEQYRYGFEVTAEKVISEWLYHKPKTQEIELFYRDAEGITTHPKRFVRGDVIKELVRDNALFLSVAAQFNQETALTVVRECFDGLKVVSGLSEDGYAHVSVLLLYANEPERKQALVELLKAADLGIESVRLKKTSLEQQPESIGQDESEYKETRVTVRTGHVKYGPDNLPDESIEFGLETESHGTQKFFFLGGLILQVLEHGYQLVVDEMDARLHPNLVEKLIALFHSKRTNPKNAQLIFTTHNTNLLDAGLFRRDQIWFTEKNRYGEGTLYSLADFKSKGARKGQSYEKKYLEGRYGAVPYLNNFVLPDPS